MGILLGLFLYKIGLSMGVSIAYSVFMAIMAIMEFYIAEGLGAKRYYTLPVAEALRKFQKLYKFLLRGEMASIIMVIPLLSIIFYEVLEWNDREAIIGMVVGFLAGLTIGINKFLKLLKRYRAIIARMSEIVAETERTNSEEDC